LGLSFSNAINEKYKNKIVNNIKGISGVIINPKAFAGNVLNMAKDKYPTYSLNISFANL
jgi:hypothetical protein